MATRILENRCMRRRHRLRLHQFTTAPELLHLNVFATTPHLQWHHSRKAEVVSLHLTTKEPPQPMEAEAALAQPATAQHFLAMELAESILMDWIVVQ